MQEQNVSPETISYSMLRIGDVFDKYMIKQLIASGGSAEVYLAEHILLKMPCALKVLKHSGDSKNDVICKRFLREAKCFHRLDHPNIVRIFDAGCDAVYGYLFITMEYLPEGTLAACADTDFQEDELLKIAADIALALKALEDCRIVHRDIKPSNIARSGGGNYKLMDFGIAKCDSFSSSDYTLTQDQTVFGTPAYISPEQCQSPHNVDHRSDIYSLGVTLYQLACGHPPFQGKTPVETVMQVMKKTPEALCKAVPGISCEFSDLVACMMNKSPHLRPADADELLRKIKNIRKKTFRKCEMSENRKVFYEVCRSALFFFILAVGGSQLLDSRISSDRQNIPDITPPAMIKHTVPAEVMMGKMPPASASAAQSGMRMVMPLRTHLAMQRSKKNGDFNPAGNERINNMIDHMNKFHSNTAGWKDAPFAEGWYIHFGQAAVEAKRTDKKLLILVTKSLFLPDFMLKDQEYIKWMQEHFVLMFCDCDYSNMPDAQKAHVSTIFRMFKIHSAPSSVILGHDGTHLASITGYKNHHLPVYQTILKEVELGHKVHFDQHNNFVRSTVN